MGYFMIRDNIGCLKKNKMFADARDQPAAKSRIR